MPMLNPPHPGEGLKEDVLAPLGLTVTETAKALGISRKTLSEIINGKSPITPDMAVRLERAFSAPPAEMWLRLQAAYDLREVSHGAARGRVRSRSLEGLRRVAPGLPTLDEALEFFTERLPGVGLQFDLKRRRIEAGVVEAIHRYGVLDRSWVSTFDAGSLRRISELEPELLRAGRHLTDLPAPARCRRT